MNKPLPLFIITTAKKRDDKEWERELAHFLLSKDDGVVIDSWQNIKKYKDVESAFFIFDEDHVTGYGAWTKTFLKIADKNRWIILSATPGDKYEDYMAVFIANGYYKNKTDFERQHLVFSPFVKFRKVQRYINTARLNRLRRNVLVDMDFDRHTVQHHETILVPYDTNAYNYVVKQRKNPWTLEPIKNAPEYCQVLRKIVNSGEERQTRLLELMEDHPRAIIFYNYDYELDILKMVADVNNFTYAEWNGHKHQPVPTDPCWMYFVNYNAGSEAWNSITTDTIIFYSENYSYRIMTQAAGRIDRMTTPYTDLYYFHFSTLSPIDKSITNALKRKKKFNETRFYDGEVYL